jgi:nucleotide-binding universal stress UspA family protein
MYRKIAVAYEDHPEAERAFKQALSLAQRLELPLTVIVVEEPLPAYTAYTAVADPAAMQVLSQDKQAFYETMASKLMNEGTALGVQIDHQMVSGNTFTGVVEFVESAGIDLLVVGLHRRALRISSLWSTVYSLSQALTCSILGVH